MALKDVLVLVNATVDHEHSLELACRLAREHQAHLTGLHVVDVPVLTSVMDVPMPEDYYELQRKPYLEAADRAQQLFERVCAQAGLQSEWRSVEGRTDMVVDLHARYADLLVLPRYARDEDAPGRRGLIEELIVTLGKPVLVAPQGELPDSIGQRIVVGWDGSREAARAVSDALPLLEHAAQVSVVAVDPVVGRVGLGDAPCADICHHLARHGVTAEAQIAVSGDRSEAEALLAWATGQDADLLVLGGYGHSRLRELVLGGVTRHVLENTAVPVLFSH